MKTYSLLILKPGSLKKKEEIIKLLKKNDMEIVTSRESMFTRETMEFHYAEHYGKPFYNTLVEYMTTGNIKNLVQFPADCLAMVVTSTRENESEEEFIARSRQVVKEVLRPALTFNRNKFKFLSDEDFKEVCMTANGIHASDSPASAVREVNNFFPDFFAENEME